MNALDFLTEATSTGASDLFIVAGRPLSCKKAGRIIMSCEERLMPAQTEALIREIYRLADRDISRFLRTGDDDFSFAVPGLSRFRISAYMQRGSMAAVIRVITFELPDPRALGIPEQVIRLGSLSKGLVLVTGPAGSGKSTTLACIIDAINQSQEKHIITMEDPLEYLHRHEKSIVSQREISSDTESYVVALRASLRQSPDVILLGEMRDFETISIAMTAAETGHLVFSTLHTPGAASTIDRIIDVFPPSQQRQIAVQLESMTSLSSLDAFAPTIVRKYCLLVKNYSRRGYSSLVQTCLDYIDFHYAENLSLDSMARLCSVTNSYLSSLFKKEVSMTLTDYINSTRIHQSLILLNTTSLSIQEIAVQCGFSDANYYARTFKKLQGQSPKGYRDSIRMNLKNNSETTP